MKFRNYLADMMKATVSSSMALGLVLGGLIFATGGATGEVSLDIELSATDSLWFMLGAPVLVSLLFLLLSPMSYLVYAALFRRTTLESNDDA